MQQTENEFVFPVRVYYEDTDATGLVYNGSYVRFMERARTEWLRYLGYEQHHLMHELGVAFVVRRAEIDYLAPARFDDLLQIHCHPTHLGKASVVFNQQVKLGETLLCRAMNKIACVVYPGMKPAAIPADLYHQMQRYTEGSG